MKVRLATATVLMGLLAVSTAGAQAATPVLDGKKVKVLTLTASGGTQDHDTDMVTDLAKDPTGPSPDRTQCAAPRCGKLRFTYKPAKGVKGDLMFTLNWTNQASDMDLYVAEVAKDGSLSDIGHCGGVGGTSEKVFLPASSLKSGKSYVLVADFFRSVNDTVTGKVQIGAPSTVKTTVPAQVDGLVYPFNCTQ